MLPADALTRPFVLFVTESPAADEGTVTYRRGCNAAVWCLCSSTVRHSLTDTPLAKTKHMLVSLFENRFFFFLESVKKTTSHPLSERCYRFIYTCCSFYDKLVYWTCGKWLQQRISLCIDRHCILF